MKTILTTLLLLCGLHTGASAKAYFQTKKEMIERAAAIAVITISEVGEGGEKGRTWVYRQKGTAKVESVLKWELPKNFTIHGGETFICASCPLREGRFLAFLKKDGDLWTGSNWHLSLRPVTGETVEWFADEITRHEMKAVPLETVLGEIKTLLAALSGPDRR